MSKRAEEMALKTFPVLFGERNGFDYTFQDRRNAFEKGYEQAEKETFNRVSDWLRENLYMYLYVCNGEPGLPMHAVIEAMRESIMEIDNE